MNTYIEKLEEKVKNHEKITKREYNMLIRHRYEESQSKTFEEWVASEVKKQ